MTRIGIRLATVVAGLAVLGGLAGDARAAAPVATTGPATKVGATTATVTGTVDPGGQSTTWYVEYGTSTGYGAKTATTAAGSGTTAVDVTASLTGLQPGTTYHYRVVAVNGTSTSHGADGVLTTLVLPVATTGSATAITATSATLNGTVDPNGRDTTFYFEWGTSTSYGTKTTAKSAGSGSSPAAVSAAISGLRAGDTYHYRLVATSDAGTSTGSDQSFRASSAPSAVTGDASLLTPTTATLNGRVTPNGLATTWWFEYGTSTAYGSKTSSQNAGSGSAPAAVSAAIKSLRAGTTYHVRLVAQNSSGKTFGDDRTFATVGPPFVQVGAAQNIAADSALLPGTLDTKGRATTWWFDYGTSTKYGASTTHRSAVTKAGTQSVSATVTGLDPATTYHFRLVARSDAGTTYGTDVTFTTAGVSLTAGATHVVFGGRVRLGGTVPTGRAGEQVVVFAQAHDEGSFHSVATVLSTAGGAWSYLARPQIATMYQASWHGGTSATVSVGVHPRVTLARLESGRFLVRVAGGRSFAHRVVQLQRRVSGHWVTVRRVRLGALSRVETRLTLPKGTSTVRAAISVNQAGAGFLGGVSRTLVVRVSG